MPFIPNELDAFHPSQASPDSQHFESLRAGSKATGVVSGCLVSAQGTPDMTVAVASGVVSVEGAKAYVTAGNLTLTADGTDPRFYLITASSAGVKSAVAGAPAPEMDPPTEPGPVFPDPAGGVVLASVYVPAADTDIDANQIDDMRVFVVPPEATTNYDLATALGIPLVKERSQTVTLDSGEFSVHELILVGSRLFGITVDTSPAILIRFNNLEDLTDRTDLTFPADGFHDLGCDLTYVPETDRVYVMFEHASRNTVAEVNPATMATSDVISDTSHPSGLGGNGGAICSDGTHLYVSTRTSPANVLKYLLSDFSFVAQGVLTGLDNGHAILYDGDSIYVGGATSPAWVAKVSPSALTFTSVSWPTGVANVTHPGLTSVGDYLWVGTEGGTGPWLWRLDKAAMTLESFVVDGPTVAAVHFDGTWVWAALSSSPGKLVRVDPQTGEMAQHTFASGENHAYAMASDGERLFIVFWGPNPNMVKRLVPPATAFPRLPGGAQIQAGNSVTFGTLVGVRNVEHAVDGNVGTGEETLLSAALTANTLSADKKALRVTATGRFAANAAAKRILLKFGTGAPATVFDTGSLLFNDAQWWLDAICVRAGANDQDWVVKWTSDSSLLATKVTHTDTTQTDTAAINILVRGVGVSANDVTNEFLLVEMMN